MSSIYVISKRKARILFFLSLTLVGLSGAAQATTTDFTEAVKMYDNQDYEQAYAVFSKLVEQDYSSIDYSFYLAQTAAKLHKNQQAITAYERILILQPNHTRAKLELGKLYYEQGDLVLSQHYFNDARNDNIPDTVRTNIDKYLDQIAKKSSKSKLSGAVILGVGHDDNINVSPEASSWFVPIFGQEFTNVTDPVESLYTHQVGILNHYYDATSTYGFGIKNSVMVYNKSIPGESEYNIFYLRYKPSLIFKYDQDTVETALLYDTMQYGGDAYLETFGFEPKISHSIDSTSLISAHLKLMFKNYLRSTDQARDARYNEVGIDYYKKLNAATTWLNSAVLAQERQDKTSSLDVSNDAIYAKTGLSYKYSATLQAGAEIQYNQKNYLDNNLFFLNKRQDSTIRAAINISKNLNKDLAIQLRAEHIDNSSNQKAYSYNKNVFLVNLINRF